MKRLQFVVLIPVKAPAFGKSRLRVPAHLRPGLATGFALDTLAAVRATPAVLEAVVVTDDPGFATRCTKLGIVTLRDGDGLNGSLVAAAASVRHRLPDSVPVALCADLPCLRSEDLSAALAQVTTDGAWFVADADTVGTTLYAASYDEFDPRFGLGSRAAHRAAGANEVTGDLATLRQDVDDEFSLAEALRLGTGEHTRDAMALLDWAGSEPAAPGTETGAVRSDGPC